MGDISKGIDKNTVAALATTLFYMYGTDANTTKKTYIFQSSAIKIFSHSRKHILKFLTWGKKVFQRDCKRSSCEEDGQNSKIVPKSLDARNF